MNKKEVDAITKLLDDAQESEAEILDHLVSLKGREYCKRIELAVNKMWTDTQGNDLICGQVPPLLVQEHINAQMMDTAVLLVMLFGETEAKQLEATKDINMFISRRKAAVASMEKAVGQSGGRDDNSQGH